MNMREACKRLFIKFIVLEIKMLSSSFGFFFPAPQNN